MSKHTPARRALIGSLVAGLVAAPLAVGVLAAPVQANPGGTSLVIREVYAGGGSTSSAASYKVDFVELYNPTSAAVSVNGWSVQYRSATGSAANAGALPNKVVAAHDTFLVQLGTVSTGGADLPTPDATIGTLNLAAASGLVILSNTTTALTVPTGNVVGATGVVDAVGYGATVTSFETARAATVGTTTISYNRSATGADTDSNAVDFTTAGPSPLAAGSTAPVSPLAATSPGDKTAVVGSPIAEFSLAATGGTAPYTWTASGLPARVTVAANGTVSGTPTAAGTYNVTATATDSTTPTAQTASTSFTITVTAPPPADPAVDIQILGTNDFHGRIQNDTSTGAAGAAVLAGAVEQLRGTNPNTTFVAAGDLIGASTFESFIAKDKPTIDALNEAGLEVSAVGNHEFDQGYDDLVNRVMAPYNADTNPYGGANWKYLGANVKFKDSNNPALDGTWMKTMGGVQVGYIGAVTEHLPELVSPGGIANIKVTDIAAAANAAADDLEAAGADVIVLLVHEGAASTDCATINTDTTSDFGKITSGVNDKIDAIVSGHTHLTYNCSQPVATWTGRPVTTRPIVSAGQYGTNLNQLVFTVDPGTGVVQAKTQAVLPLKNGTTGSTFNYPVDANTQTIVTNAVNNANVLGAQPLGTVASAFYRAKLSNGTTENRGGESTLGNLVAEIQRQQTSGDNRGGAQIAFMNPGGLRADLTGQGTAAFPRTVTYKDAANVQPFANTLVNEALTGAQIKAALEQQWQPAGASRPFLKLGISKGFAYTYNPAAAQGSRITAMYLNGTPIDPGATYSVTVNSFLSTGGDNFAALNGAARKQDTGVTDLQAQVDYFAANASGAAGLPVDYSQRAVGAVVSTATPTAGQDVTINLSSLSMTGPGDLRDASIEVTLDGASLGSFPVTTTVGDATYDEVGTATAVVRLPVRASGAKTLVVTGDNTGTVTRVPITVTEAPSTDVQILATNDFHGRIQNDSTSSSAGAAVLAGAVKQFRAANPATSFVAAGDLIGASTFESFIQKDKPTIDALNEAGLDVSAVGNHEFDQGYNDLVNRVMQPYNADTNPYGGAGWKYIGANVKFRDSGNPALDPSFVKTQGGIQVGYIGAVTEHLPELVSPGGISNIQVTNIASAVNSEANVLKAAGADVIVLLVHEGAAGTDCATINTDTTSDFGKITSAVNDNIDAIVSGHTHLVYNCSQPVAGWAGRPVTERPIVSAGQYGSNLNKLNFVVDKASGVVQSKTQTVLPLKSGTATNTNLYPVDSNTQTIVTNAVNQSNVLGAQPLGQLGGSFYRAKLADGTTENRGGESTLGNLVAEIQRQQTAGDNRGGAQIAFMNPGGLRADLTGQGTAAFPRTLTYKDAANVQPFANTLVNEALTGAQIKAALEQQWQPTGAARPFLKLGISKGFTYTYDPAAAQGSRIKAMYLNGDRVDLAATYSVTVNSFLSTGGDNFTALNGTARKQDTGVTDLQAQVDYFAALGANTPAPVDYTQRAVGAVVTTETPTGGQDVTINLSSLSMTGPGDLTDTSVTVSLDGVSLGSFPVTTTKQTALPGFDEVGTATAVVTLPFATAGDKTLVVTGFNTGTVARVPITVAAAPTVATTVDGTADPVLAGDDATVEVTVTPATATGTVELLDGTTVIASTTLTAGTGTITVPAAALEAGDNVFTLSYLGAEGYDPSTGSVTINVSQVGTTVTGDADPVTFGEDATVIVEVTPDQDNGPVTGTVRLLNGATVVSTVDLVDGAGNIMVPAAALKVGSNVFTLDYTGSPTYSPSVGTVTVKVTRINADVRGSSDPFAYGQAGAVTVTVGPTTTTVPTGSVTVSRDGSLIGTIDLNGGTGTLVLPALDLKPGTYVLDLVYFGDDTFTPDDGAVTVTVAKATAAVSATVTPARSVVRREGSRFAVTVTAPGSYTPTGKVELIRGGTVLATGVLSGGRVTIATPVWATVGTQSVQVHYVGDDYATAKTITKSVVVVKQTPTMTVNAPASVRRGKAPTVTVTMKATGIAVTGQVKFTVQGKTVTRSLSGGKVSYKLPRLTAKTTVKITYVGTTQLNAVTKSKTIKVNP